MSQAGAWFRAVVMFGCLCDVRRAKCTYTKGYLSNCRNDKSEKETKLDKIVLYVFGSHVKGNSIDVEGQRKK
jgi:hypothetical protein